jgi:uncharacterized protein YhaN
VRFLELSLIAFGPFTDRRIDLSGGSEGLHLVFGPNEAGKSSALRAVVDLLFGIPVQTRDAHLHDNQALRIGGHLRRTSGEELRFIRRKGTKRTILGPNEEPLPDSVLEPFVGGVTRELFVTMFGLDHARLIEGASSLLEGQGQLGASLFGASIGTTRLHQVLAKLELEADELFNARAVKPKINQGIKRWQELERRVRDTALPAQEWRRLERELSDLEGRRERLALERQGLAVHAARIERIQRALPKIGLFEERLRERSELESAPLLPEDAAESRRAAVRARNEARRQAGRSRALIDELEKKLSSLHVASEVIELEPRIVSLKERLTEYRQASAELPAIEAELLRVARARSRVEASLTVKKPSAPRRATRARLDALARQEAEIDTVRGRAWAELAERQRHIERAERDLGKLEIAKSPGALRATIRNAARSGDLEGELARIKRDAAKLEVELASQLLRLGLFTGTIDELERGRLPESELIEKMRDELASLDAERDRLFDRKAELSSRLTGVETELDAIKRRGAPPTEAELEAARADRDGAWRAFRASKRPAAEIADRFETALARSDEIADRLRREAERVAQRAALEAKQSADLEAIAETEDALRSLEERASRSRSEWIALWKDLGSEPRSPKEMLAFRQRLDAILDRSAKLRAIRADQTHVADLAEAQRKAIDAAIREAGETPAEGTSLASMLELAEDLATRMDEALRKKKSLEEKIAELVERRSALETEVSRTDRALEAWREEWQSALEAAGLSTELTPIEARAVIESLEEHQSLSDEEARLHDRRSVLMERKASFEAIARSITSTVSPELDREPSDQAVEALYVRSAEARTAASARAEIEERLAHARLELASVVAQEESAERTIAQLLARASAPELDALERAEERSDRRRAVDLELRSLEAQLLEIGGGLPLRAILAEAKEIAPDRVALEAKEHKERLEQLESEISSLDREIGARRGQRDGIEGKDEAARIAEESAAVGAEVRGHVERFLRVRLAATLLRLQIDRYREENAVPLLQRSGAILSRLTLGSLVRLETAIDAAGRPVLYAVRRSGQRVDVPAMSDGTRDQLYLALRLATLERYLAANAAEPIPFILDDILLNFDDERSEAALEVLGEMSERTQVLLFTHHHRVVELAHRSLSSDKLYVHPLGATASQRQNEAAAV